MLPPQPWHWALGEGGSGVVAVGGWQWVAGPIGAVSWSRPWWQGWRCGCSIFRAEILGESSGEVRGHNGSCRVAPKWSGGSFAVRGSLVGTPAPASCATSTRVRLCSNSTSAARDPLS